MEDIGKINALKEKIDLYYYVSFDSVQHFCDEIIRLSQGENLIGYRLEAIYNLCWCAYQHGRMKEAQSYVTGGNQLLRDHLTALSRVDTTGIHQANMINATGILYYDLGNYDDAIEAFSRIITLDSSPLTGDSSVLRSSSNYLGQSYYKLGSLDKALQYFELAKGYIQKDDPEYTLMVADYYAYLAEYQFSMSLISDAFTSLKRSKQWLEKEKNGLFVRSRLQSNLLWTANLFQEIEEYDSAIRYVDKAIALFDRNDPGLTGNYRFIGDIHYKRGRLDSALSCYTRSLDLANRVYKDRHYTKSEALVGIGNVCRDRKLFHQACSLYKEGLNCLLIQEAIHNFYELSSENLGNILLPMVGMDVLIEQARLFNAWYLYNGNTAYLDSSLAMLKIALQLNDLSRRELTNVRTRESRAKRQKEITDLGVEVAHKAYESSHDNTYIKKAYDFMEKGRGNILLDQVNEVNARKFSGIPEDILAEESRLKGELSVIEGRLLKIKRTDEGYAEIKSDYDEKQRKYITLVSELEQMYPRYFKLKYDTKTLQVEDVQRQLSSNHSVLIQYFIGNDKIYMAGITKKTVVLLVTERNAEFDRNLYILLDQLANSNIIEVENDTSLFKEFVRTTDYLYTKILYPVLQKIKSPVDELIIIPDDFLSYLPFEILLTERPEIQEMDYSLLPYLIRKYQIRYDYSASLIMENEDRWQKRRRSYIGYAPTYENSVGHGNGVTGMFTPGLLYANKGEIEACRNIWKGTSMLGKRATERSFREFASRVSILHLATHTFLDDEDPQRSCFAFTNDQQDPEDGFLFCYELYNMNILANLVILSGCETGTGHNKKGEGIISLARAFKYAGCPNIIMSLWKVNDQTTKEIMILFNKNLKKGMEKDKALQRAKITYLKGTRNLHPVFWSSFVLIGNDDPIRHSGKGFLYGLILCCLLLLTIRTIRNRIVFMRYSNIQKNSQQK